MTCRSPQWSRVSSQKNNTHGILGGFTSTPVRLQYIHTKCEVYQYCTYLCKCHKLLKDVNIIFLASLPSWTLAIPALLMRRWRGSPFCLYSSVNLFTDWRDAKSRGMNSTLMDLSGCSRDTSSVMREMAWGKEQQWMHMRQELATWKCYYTATVWLCKSC